MFLSPGTSFLISVLGQVHTHCSPPSWSSLGDGFTPSSPTRRRDLYSTGIWRLMRCPTLQFFPTRLLTKNAWPGWIPLPDLGNRRLLKAVEYTQSKRSRCVVFANNTRFIRASSK